MISLSHAAVGEVKRLQSKLQDPNVLLRLRVQPGGCSGLFYQLGFEKQAQPGDRAYKSNETEVIIDSLSLEYADGLTLDYSEDLMGGAFRFENPNAAQTCACGQSFALVESL